jgi:hypothetical protein
VYFMGKAQRSVLAEAERLRILSPTERDMVRLVNEPGFSRWLEQIKNTGGCAHPIYLAGHSTVRDAFTGEVLQHFDTRAEPGGRIPVRCRNRRHSRCEPCSRVHSGDTFHLVRSGLVGGKSVREGVKDHPRLFVTLTAPSFGAVHRGGGDYCHPRRSSGSCEHGRPVGCGVRHADDDPVIGQPVCGSCYDYPGHALWNAHSGRLWNRYCHQVRRRLASEFGIKQTRLREYLTVGFAKVAEYQRRGAVHFHAVVRLDGPDGPSSPPPPWATAEVLEQVIRASVETVEVRAPYSPAVGDRVIRWGKEMEAHPIRNDAFSGTVVTDSAVAAYVAKYVSKGVGDSGGIDYRVMEFEGIRLAPVTAHVRALMAACWRLGALPEYEELRLRAWAHTLGYRGHVLTKSRWYSTTYAELRAPRAEYQAGDEEFSGCDDGTVTDSVWRYVGSGHTLGEAEIAAGIADDLVVLREIRRDLREGWVSFAGSCGPTVARWGGPVVDLFGWREVPFSPRSHGPSPGRVRGSVAPDTSISSAMAIRWPPTAATAVRIWSSCFSGL